MDFTKGRTRRNETYLEIASIFDITGVGVELLHNRPKHNIFDITGVSVELLHNRPKHNIFDITGVGVELLHNRP